MLEFDETQRLSHAFFDFIFRNVGFLQQPEGNILADRQRIKERALLKYDSHSPPQFKKIVLAHPGDVFAKNVDAPGVRSDQPKSKFQDRAFARTGYAEDGLGLAMAQLK